MRGLTEVFDGLTAEYEAWCAEQKLPCISADELLHASYCGPDEGGVTMSDEQRKWICDFSARWEQALKDEQELLA